MLSAIFFVFFVGAISAARMSYFVMVTTRRFGLAWRLLRGRRDKIVGAGNKSSNFTLCGSETLRSVLVYIRLRSHDLQFVFRSQAIL
jgi:hypothetical protein